MKQMKILWVDDEIEFLKPFVLFLEDRDYSVATANNGGDAIDMFLNEKFDLVILDEMMPGLDGLTTLAEIKRINNSIPIIMVTKSEEEGLMDKAIASQITDYLIKPINPNQVIMAIKKIFQADEIRQSKIGEQYSQFSAQLNQRLFTSPDWKDWMDIYKELCRWDLQLDELNDPALIQTHFLEKRNCNTEFTNYIERNYAHWLKTDERPNFSFDVVSEYLAPQLDKNVPVYFIILDCMRLDQYYALEPFLKEMFDVSLDLYFSILPTATPYSRNSIFSGMLPIDIAKRFPEYWNESSEMDNSKNRNEHQLLDEHIEDIGYHVDPVSKYVKIFNMEEGNFVLRKVESWNKEKLIVLVYNFLDLLAHHRSRDMILQETIPDEEALRAFTKHWFLHSSLYETLKLIAKQGGICVITTDHGSIKVNRATQVVGDRDTTITVRYKEGKNLTCNDRHAIYLKKPEEFGLPSKNIVDSFIFAKDDYYFVYPNSYHQYQKQYNGTFQHGGVSMEEMILPLSICRPKS
ncbi:MAG TPA: bifunctional response regulator/alkaline phosphatase family protein [Candidatus Cloacimonadota bacterium]|nr:bifunctional response regulator/alkaline phosphatase family protein [Candidatus Cloacimonadota bacterium]HPT71035.1 bifunctional response regulator/alkaline phosphatase family protein [Candidatus Cloacimonadota bacterium]